MALASQVAQQVPAASVRLVPVVLVGQVDPLVQAALVPLVRAVPPVRVSQAGPLVQLVPVVLESQAVRLVPAA